MATARNLETEFDTVKADLATLRGDVASLVATLQQTGKDKAKNAAAQAQAEIEATAARLRDLGKQGADDLSLKVQERPLASVLIAFGVGALLGRLMAR